MLIGVILYHRFICVCVLKCKGVLIPLKGLADNLLKAVRTFGSEPQGIESRVASINRQHPRPRWSIRIMVCFCSDALCAKRRSSEALQ